MAVIYDKRIMPIAQDLLGTMFDFSVYGLGIKISDIFDLFLDSRFCKFVEKKDSCTLIGKSGIELCYDVSGVEHIDECKMEEYYQHSIVARSREYWAGWAIAYYQYITSLSFVEINDLRNVDDIADMYDVYHEMDISHFSDRMNELYLQKHPDTRLKAMRINARLSQSELAQITQIPIKTIQQYEQRRKNINNARVDYLISLSNALKCDIELLVEKVIVDN